MNILYCGDEQITDGLLISVLSLLKQVKEPLCVYVFTLEMHTKEKSWMPIKEKVIRSLDQTVKEKDPSGFVKLFDLTKWIEQDELLLHGKSCTDPETVLKLYADRILEMPERLLYLEHTVICCRDCSSFYHQDMQAYEMAAVMQQRTSFFFRKRQINDGVLLFDLTKLRETKALEKCRVFCSRASEKNKQKTVLVQEALQRFVQTKKICPRQYNEQSKLYIDTVFQHITMCRFRMPWKRAVLFEPWNAEQVHQYLKVQVHDTLLQEYEQQKKKSEKGSD